MWEAANCVSVHLALAACSLPSGKAAPRGQGQGPGAPRAPGAVCVEHRGLYCCLHHPGSSGSEPQPTYTVLASELLGSICWAAASPGTCR